MKCGTRMELIIVTCVSFLLVIVSCFPLFVTGSYIGTGYTYFLTHNYPLDFWYYLSLMRQGWEGHIFLIHPFFPGEQTGHLINMFFPVLGMLARVLSMPLHIMYLVARIGFGTLFLVLSWIFARRILPALITRIVFFLFAICSASFLYTDPATQVIRWYGDFWTELDPVMRLSFLPHHTAAMCFLVGSFLLLEKGLGKQKWMFIIAASVCAAGAVFCNPATFVAVVSVCAGLGLFLIYQAIRKKSFRFQTFQLPIIYLVMYALGAILVALYLFHIQNTVYPWTYFRDWEAHLRYPIRIRGLLGSLGIIGIFAVFGLGTIVKKLDWIRVILIGWFIGPFLGFAFQDVIPATNARYLQLYIHIPAAILAAWLVSFIGISLYRKKKWYTYSWWGIIFLGFFITILPTWILVVEARMKQSEKDSHGIFVQVPNNVIQSFLWLEKHVGPKDVVAGPEWVTMMLPAFTNARMFSSPKNYRQNKPVWSSNVERLIVSADWRDCEDVLDQYAVTYLYTDITNDPAAHLTSFERVYDENGVYWYKRIEKP